MNNPSPQKAIVLVSFGVSYSKTRQETIDVLYQQLVTRFPDHLHMLAFTSEMIRDILRKRGEYLPNTDEALRALAGQGVTEVIIQPTHLIAGSEYHKMLEHIDKWSHHFKHITVGKPLLCDPSDYMRVVNIFGNIYQRFVQDRNGYLVLMGHGSEHPMNAAYPALAWEFERRGFDNILVGTVEGYPSFDDTLALLKQKTNNASAFVLLMPLLFVAGDHAQNDMSSDEEDSWKTELIRAGYEVKCLVKGMGEFQEILDMYLDHISEAQELSSAH